MPLSLHFAFKLKDVVLLLAVLYHGTTENEDGTVTLCFRTNGILDTPEVCDAENVERESFDARWEAVENATQYICELYSDSILLLCDTLRENTRHYDGLTITPALRYRVRAMADSPEDYLESPWSRFSSLELLVGVLPVSASPDPTESGEETLPPIYNLSGQRLCTPPSHGIFIQRGKKIVW